MIPYWLLWSFFWLGLIFSSRAVRTGGAAEIEQPPGLSLMLLVGFIAMTLMIGLRFQVGADWEPYQRMFAWSGQATFEQVLDRADPGYFVINWLAQEAGADVWLVNLFCGAVVAWGIAAMSIRQPQPWLSALLAIPYLVTVVAMGYTRQAAALGFVLVGLAGLLRHNSIVRYVLWVTLAATFHKTAMVCLPLVAVTGQRRRIVDIALLASATIGLYLLFLKDSVDTLVDAYIGAKYASSGAAVRISMSIVPAVVLLLFRTRLGFSPTELRLWRNYSIVSIIAAVALAVSPSSTAVDRVALYLLPLQFVVLARIPGTLIAREFGNLLVSAYSFIVLFTWLNFAVHARYWLPYRWILAG